MKRTVVIAGKNNIAVDVLNYLKTHYGDDLQLMIICNRTETGQDGWQRSLRLAAERLGVLECGLEDIYGLENMVFVSLEFDRIIRPEKFVSRELYNIHFSLLPKYRGMYTSILPILNGEKLSGVTLHRIDRGIDTGDIIAQVRIPLKLDETAESLYGKYLAEGTALARHYLGQLIFRPWEIHAVPQKKDGATYYSHRAVDYQNLKIDLNQTASSVNQQIRAFSFRHYQMPEIYGKKVITSEITGNKSQHMPGTILAESDIGFVMATVDYDVAIYYDRFDELMVACRAGELSRVREICTVRQHINQKNEKGESPYMVSKKSGNETVALFLRCCGAKINNECEDMNPAFGGGNSPLNTYAVMGTIWHILIQLLVVERGMCHES